MVPRDLSDYPGPDDPPLANAPNASPEERRRARVWARRVLQEAEERRIARVKERGPVRWAHLADETTPIAFISSINAGASAWQPILDRLDGGNPTVTYDRPGIGSRPPRPAPNPPIPYSMFADELAAHIEAQGVAGPVAVVGRSVGSLIARMFAARHPHLVAGVVHVDGSIPRFHLPTGDTIQPVIDGGTEIDTIAGEVEILRASAPRVPAVVVARTPGWYDDQLPHPAIDDLWHLHQQRLADEWNAPLLVAERAGHGIPDDAPALVAYAIGAVMVAAQQDAPVRVDRSALEEAGGRLGYGSSMR